MVNFADSNVKNIEHPDRERHQRWLRALCALYLILLAIFVLQWIAGLGIPVREEFDASVVSQLSLLERGAVLARSESWRLWSAMVCSALGALALWIACRRRRAARALLVIYLSVALPIAILDPVSYGLLCLAADRILASLVRRGSGSATLYTWASFEMIETFARALPPIVVAVTVLLRSPKRPPVDGAMGPVAPCRTGQR